MRQSEVFLHGPVRALVVDMMEGLVSYQRAAAAEPFNADVCKASMYAGSASMSLV